MDRGAAVEVLEKELGSHRDVQVRMAWRTIKPLVERGGRVSQTLSMVNTLAQRAIRIREALDTVIPAIPPTLFAIIAEARVDITAIIEAFKTGAPNDPPPRD